MTRLRRRRLLKMLALVAVPPLFWVGVLALVPTGWARQKVVDRLQAATGQTVSLEALRLRPLGGVRLDHLTLGEQAGDQPPWFRAESIVVDLNLAQLLLGQLEPRCVQVRGFSMRLRRDADGHLDWASALRATPRAESDPLSCEDDDGTAPAELNLRLNGGQITLIDELHATRIALTNVSGCAVWSDELLALNELRGDWNGGSVVITAEIDHGDRPGVDGQLRVQDVAMSESWPLFRYLVPLLGSEAHAVQGRLDLDLYLRSRGTTRDEWIRHLVGQGRLSIDPISLNDSAVVSELAGLIRLPADRRIGAVTTDFTIAQRRVSTQHLSLEVAGIPVVLPGWTDFDGPIDYRFQSNVGTGALHDDVRGLLVDLPVRLDDLIAVRLVGTLEDPILTVDGIPLNDHPDQLRSKLMELSRRLRDRIFR